MDFILAGLLVLTVTQGGGHLARRLGQPFVMGELVGGIVLGPAVLGTLVPGVMDRILAPDILTTIGRIGELGVLLLCAGIGFELRHAARNRAVDPPGPRLIVPVLIIPAVLGAGLALATPEAWRPTADLAPYVILCVCAMTVTALPVLGAILRDLDLVRRPAGTSAMALAGIADLVCWVLLAIALELHRGVDLAAGLAHVALLGGVGALSCLVVAKIVGMGLRGRGLGDRALVTVVLVGTCAMAAGATLIDVHPAFAALVFGALLPPEAANLERVLSPLLDLNASLLLPFFLVAIGLAFDPWSLGGPWTYAVAGLVCLLAIVAKVSAAVVGAWAEGLPWRPHAGLGMLLSARGFTEILLLSVGREAGIIGHEVFTIGIIVTVVTTLLAAPGYLWLTEPRRRVPIAPRPAAGPREGVMAGEGARAA